jgi:serine/threonine-protein kinase
MVVGTPGFLAPELVSDRRSFDGRADIYALGCVAFWLLTGHPPFEGPDAMSVLMQHSSAAPLAPSARSEQTIPADLDALVLECLSKDMAGRPSSADALWQRLDTLSVGRAWDPRQARTWWQLHEPDLVAHS